MNKYGIFRNEEMNGMNRVEEGVLYEEEKKEEEEELEENHWGAVASDDYGRLHIWCVILSIYDWGSRLHV